MHELAVTEGILEVCLRHAEKAGAKRIVAINLVIGQLSSIIDDSIQFYWDIISAETIAKGAQLNFKRIPAEMRCADCGTVFALDGSRYNCPECASQRLQVHRGVELRVESIDVE